MRVIIDIEIETTDYEGKAFKKEVEELIKDIDPSSRLTRFKMRGKYGVSDPRDIDWKEK